MEMGIHKINGGKGKRSVLLRVFIFVQPQSIKLIKGVLLTVKLQQYVLLY